MSIAKYPNYKRTDERWVTHVPEHWYMLSGKRVFKNIRIRALKTDEQLAASQAYGVIPQSLMMKKNDAKVMLALKGTESFRHVDVNDFVISLRSFEGGIEHSKYTGCVSPAYTVLKPEEFCSPEYYRHLLKSDGFISALQSTTDSLRDGKSISYEQFGSITLPSPPLHEQQKIAQFLDYETAKIDALIDEQKRLIELLKEKRQAVISHAVTKGLNPDAPMKDSGVEWLGEVPEHWEVTKLGYLGNAIIGLTYSPDDIIDEGGAIVLRSTNIQNGRVSLHDNVQVSKKISDKLRLRVGDVLICSRNGSRALIGKNALIDESAAGHTFGAFTTVFRSTYNPFLRYIFDSRIFSAQAGLFMTTTVNQLTTGTLNQMQIALPPVNEQTEIIGYLDDEVMRIEFLTSECKLSVKLLQERRSALISAAVTGKIDVRDWQPPAGSDTVDSNASVQTERHYG